MNQQKLAKDILSLVGGEETWGVLPTVIQDYALI